jgi:hypothetical protein
MENKQTITIGIIALLIGLGGGFYGGMKYMTNQNTAAALARGGNGGFQRGGGMMTGSQTPGQRGGAQGGGVMGQIASKDATSLTVKMPDGSSKIVFYSDSTTVAKSTAGSASDLMTGEQIRANGKANPDGSIAAQSIQIVPMTPASGQ